MVTIHTNFQSLLISAEIILAVGQTQLDPCPAVGTTRMLCIQSGRKIEALLLFITLVRVSVIHRNNLALSWEW